MTKKHIFILLTLILMILVSFGCDSPSSGRVCTENVTGIAGTAAAKLYYPCTVSGQIPASTMSSGWTAGLSAIEWLSRPMAGEGTVVLAFTPLNRYGMVTDWERAHKNTFNRLKQINRSHRTLAGKIDEGRMQIAGYSKGGGGTLAAAADLGGEVASAIGMAPYHGGEYPISSLRSMRAKTFIQCGGASDSLARPTMTKQEFDALPNSITKLYRRHSSWGHLVWGGGAQSGTAQREIFAWMNYYLRGDTSGGSILSNKTGLSGYEWINK